VPIQIGSDPKTQVAALVSCVMLTRNRFRQAQFAIASYQRQTWKRRELIIADASNDEKLRHWIASLGDASIRLVPDVDASEYGEKLRGQAIAAAGGAYLCRWGDDGLYHPARLEAQLAVLKSTRSRLNIIGRGIAWDPIRHRLSLYDQSLDDRSLLCERSVLRDITPEPSAPGRSASGQRYISSASASVLDLPELNITVVDSIHSHDARYAESLWERSAEKMVLHAYDATLARLARCYPIKEYKRAIEEGIADASAAEAGEPAR
jgi:hypothetical protein